MTLKEFRKVFNALSDEKKEKMIVDLYRRQDRQGKELEEVILECIRDDKELPPLKAQIPPVAATEKKLQKLWSDLLYWRIRRPKSVTRFKQSVKELYRQLSVCPSQAECYGEAVRQLMSLFRLLGAADKGLVPVHDVFQHVNLPRDDFFRTLCSMILAQGYTREALERLIGLCGSAYVSDIATALHQAEILLTFIKNGDLRLEILDLLEEKIRTALHDQSPSGIDGELVDNLCFLYFVTDEQEAGEEAARKDLEKIIGSAWMRGFDQKMREAREENKEPEEEIWLEPDDEEDERIIWTGKDWK